MWVALVCTKVELSGMRLPLALEAQQSAAGLGFHGYGAGGRNGQGGIDAGQKRLHGGALEAVCSMSTVVFAPSSGESEPIWMAQRRPLG